MFIERTSVGLDVHARSIAAAAIDNVTGEVVKRRLVHLARTALPALNVRAPDRARLGRNTVGWPGPVAP